MQNKITKPKTIPQNIWDAAQLIASIIERKRKKLEELKPPQNQITMGGEQNSLLHLSSVKAL